MNSIDGIKLATISNTDLEFLAKKYKIQLNNVIMKDELKTATLDGNYICNLQNSNQGGSHWIAFHKNGLNVYWFDPFGVDPLQGIIDQFTISPAHESIYVNSVQIQDIDSELCGFFCLGFFIAIKKNTGSILNRIEKFNNLFNKNTKKNDAILKKYLKKYFNNI